MVSLTIGDHTFRMAEGERQTVRGLACGTQVAVEVRGDACAPTRREVWVDSTNSIADFRLRRPHSVALEVVDDLTGEAISDFEAVLWDDGPGGWRLDAAGGEPIEGPVGAYLHIRAEGYASVSIELRPEWPDMLVRMRPLRTFQVACSWGNDPCPRRTLAFSTYENLPLMSDGSYCTRQDEMTWRCVGGRSPVVKLELDGFVATEGTLQGDGPLRFDLSGVLNRFCADVNADDCWLRSSTDHVPYAPGTPVLWGSESLQLQCEEGTATLVPADSDCPPYRLQEWGGPVCTDHALCVLTAPDLVLDVASGECAHVPSGRYAVVCWDRAPPAAPPTDCGAVEVDASLIVLSCSNAEDTGPDTDQ